MGQAQVSSPLVSELIEVLGEDGYFELGRAMGGGLLYVPRQFPDGHWLVRAVGTQVASLLCEYWNGVYLVLPVQDWRRFALARLANLGLSGDEIARELRVSRSWVYETLAARHDARQSRLFD